MSGAPSSKCRSSPTSTSPTSRRCSAPRRRRSCRSDGRRHLQAAAAARRDHHGRQRPLGGCARAHAFRRPPRRTHAGAHVYRGVRAPRRGGPHAVRFLERELESAGGGGRQSHGSVPRGARPRDRGAAREGCTGALRRGTPQSLGAAAGAYRGRGGAHRRQWGLEAPGGCELRRALGYYPGDSKACERMLKWRATAGRHQRGPLRRTPRARGTAGGGSADPHRRRVPRQQLPALGSRLRGAVFQSAAVAGFRGGGSRGRARVLRQPRTALRPRRSTKRIVTDVLRTRILTAVVLAALLLVIVLWLPAGVTVGVITLLALVGAWEWSAFLLLGTPALRAAYGLLVAALLLGAWRVSATPEGRDLLLSVAVLWWLIALLWIAFAPRRVAPWSAGAAGVLALVPAWLALVRLRLALPHGAQWVLFALLLVWVADIGAFFCGRRFGRVRLAPNVSPGKTWEGVLGAIAVSAGVAVAGSLWFQVPLAAFLPLCLAAVGFLIIGDLHARLLKRFAGVKDSGRVFPGHGGVMDRIDSLTGAAPVLLLGLTRLGVIG